jgi:hypothetical protein
MDVCGGVCDVCSVWDMWGVLHACVWGSLCCDVKNDTDSVYRLEGDFGGGK